MQENPVLPIARAATFVLAAADWPASGFLFTALWHRPCKASLPARQVRDFSPEALARPPVCAGED